MSSVIVPRRFRRRAPSAEPSPEGTLSDFLSARILVLLGEPGMGKTTCFKEASAAEGAHFLTVSEFLDLSPNRFRGISLYLDGLDEARALDGNVLSKLSRHLDEARPSRVRLSCRVADWRDPSDAARLTNLLDEPPVEIELLPLTAGQIKVILDARGLDGAIFISQALDRDLMPLLENPQTLDLLAESVGREGTWPASRRVLFETALDKLLLESNETHRRATDTAIPPSRLMAAADRLAALMLLANLEACALTPTGGAGPSIYDLGGDFQAIGVAARRRLFTPVAPERVALKHRTVGEFLAARHLARLVREGLPLARVLALITGFDGAPLTDLRGVFGWLVVHLPQDAAELLVQRDPAGVIAYGDTVSWPLSVCHAALNHLESSDRALGSWFRVVGRAANAGFARPEMVDRFRGYLTGRGDLIHLAIVALAAGAPLPELGDDLLNIVRDASWGYLRAEAAQAFLHGCPNRKDELVEILEDIAAGRNTDDGYHLRRNLLRLLYPEYVPPGALVRLVAPGDDPLWRQVMVEAIARTPDHALPELADHVAAWKNVSSNFAWLDVGNALCTRLIPRHGSSECSQRLYRWLSIGVMAGTHFHRDTAPAVRDFLADHPDVVLALFHHWLDQQFPATASECCNGFGELLYALRGLDPPASFVPGLLELACRSADDGAAQSSAWEAIRLTKLQPPEEAQVYLEQVFEAAERDARVAAEVERSFLCHLPDPRPHADAEAKWQAVQGGLMAEIEVQRDALLSGRAVELLRKAASIAAGRVVVADISMHVARMGSVTARERLDTYYGEAAGLVLTGLRRFPMGAFPSPETIALIACAGGRDPSVSLLVDIVELQDVLDLAALPQQAVAALAAVGAESDDGPSSDWRGTLRDLHPESVESAAFTYLETLLKHGRWAGHFLRLDDGAFTGSHPFKGIVQRRCFDFLQHRKHCWGDVLRTLLHVALVRDPQRTRGLALEAWDDPALGSLERGYWVAAAFAADERLGERWQSLVAVDHKAREAAVWFLGIALSEPEIGPSLTTNQYSRCIDVVLMPGPEIQHQAELILSLVNALGRDPSELATDTLAKLAVAPVSAPFLGNLERAIELQAQVRREHEYSSPTVQEIVAALSGGPPATGADRVATVAEEIKQLGEELRNATGDGWRQFWNENGTPRGENACRDYLQTLLRPRLAPMELTVDREGDFARHARADLVIHQGPRKTPIEIKRHWNADLWRAPAAQLQGKYMNDPACDGGGIYLVLWFSSYAAEKPPCAPDGTRPASVDELRQALERLCPLPGVRHIVLDCG